MLAFEGQVCSVELKQLFGFCIFLNFLWKSLKLFWLTLSGFVLLSFEEPSSVFVGDEMGLCILGAAILHVPCTAEAWSVP